MLNIFMYIIDFTFLLIVFTLCILTFLSPCVRHCYCKGPNEGIKVPSNRLFDDCFVYLFSVYGILYLVVVYEFMYGKC